MVQRFAAFLELALEREQGKSYLGVKCGLLVSVPSIAKGSKREGGRKRNIEKGNKLQREGALSEQRAGLRLISRPHRIHSRTLVQILVLLLLLLLHMTTTVSVCAGGVRTPGAGPRCFLFLAHLQNLARSHRLRTILSLCTPWITCLLPKGSTQGTSLQLR